jgi:plasmid maintenance system antidote protein VapI
MTMHNPPHPGEFITSVYREPFGVSGRSRVTPDMALRLSKALGRRPESWLAMQDAHDLWLARQSTDLAQVSKLGVLAVG